ncbi:hypothetical protein [Hugenholtzia roseola]|uniref:hypothetical protein n=1 Tax=Hugenholtzia roseola TaxID=1002 RepID=UPI0012B6395D|nr:hypothetical protein [Hugenholtzia roseola]
MKEKPNSFWGRIWKNPSFKLWLRRCLLLFLGLGVLLGFFFFRSPNFARSVFLKSYYLKEVRPNLYVDRNLDTAKIALLEQNYQQAQARVQTFFGSLESKPYLLAGDDPEVMRLFGNENIETGMTHLSPVGTYIVLAKEGLNVDVISHELCHAELMARTGWFLREFQIPTWFDEGLAMLLDERFPNWETEWHMMTLNGSYAPELEEMDTPAEFFNRDAYLHYLTAKKQVGTWHQMAGREGLLLFIETLKKERDFPKAFHAPLKKYQK